MKTCYDVEQGQCNLNLVKSIKELLLQQPLCDNAKWSIYRIPKPLLNMNCKAYNPEVITIGPFHHGKKDLMGKQQLKSQCLNSYLRRINWEVEDIVAKAKGWEEKARRCYAEPIIMSSDDFVKMMLMDGCFIVELLLRINGKAPDQTQNKFDQSFDAIRFDVYRDLTMLENQLPFFVVQGLFDLVPLHKEKDGIPLTKLMVKLFCNNGGLIGNRYTLSPDVLRQNVNHLLDLLRCFYVPSSNTEEYWKDNNEKDRKFILPPTVTQLLEAGVKVKKAKEAKSLLDISFKNGVLEIPPFDIHDDFESCIRNLMAFERYHVEDSEKYVLHYISFLDGLINTKEDSALLVKEGIMFNFIGGSREEDSKLFNNLCKYYPNPRVSYYYRTSQSLHAHTKKWWNKSMATLKRDYFNSPWSYISFIAGTFLIILTFLQTIFSVLSIFHH